MKCTESPLNFLQELDLPYSTQVIEWDIMSLAQLLIDEQESVIIKISDDKDNEWNLSRNGVCFFHRIESMSDS